MSRPARPSSTPQGIAAWSALATCRNGRSKLHSVISVSSSHGFATDAPSRNVKHSGRRSCRRICAGRPASKRCIRGCISRASARATSGRRSRRCWGRRPEGSPTTITRLKTVWEQEYAAWAKRSLADRRYIYVWADGVYFNVRLEDTDNTRQCMLVLMGATRDGKKELIAITDVWLPRERAVVA